MKPEIVCFIQAFLFKRCAYITHNAIQLDWLHIFRCFMQVSDIRFPLDATRDFFFWANDNIIILLFENGFPAFIHQSGAHTSGEQSNETSVEGLWCRDFKCKRKASWERGETKTVPVTQPRLVVPWTLVLYLDRSTFVVGEQAVRSSSRGSLHRWSSFSADESVERSARRRASAWKMSTENQQIQNTVTKLLCSSIVTYILFSISCLSFPSIKLFGKAFHNHKTFQFSFFFFVHFYHIFTKTTLTFDKHLLQNDVEAERKSKNNTASHFLSFFFFLCFCCLVFRATADAEIGCLSSHRGGAVRSSSR